MGSTVQNYAMTGCLMLGMVLLFLFLGYALAGLEGMVMALLLSGMMNLMAWWQSGQQAIQATGAQPISPQQAPFLHETVERLARAADIPKPDVYLVETDMPNAFATGPTPAKGKVAVTSGIVRLLDEDELAGVIAHELAHIEHYDILTSSVAGVFAGALTYLAQMGRYTAMTSGAYRGSDRSGRARRSNFAGIGVLVMLLAPLAATVIRLAISRDREFKADAGGARMLGNPLPLANALAKMAALPPQAMASEAAHPAIAHMFIISPYLGGLDNLFKTHPPTEERIRRLREMADEMGITR